MKGKIVMLEKLFEKSFIEQNMGEYAFKGNFYESVDWKSFKPCGEKIFYVISDALSEKIKDECNRTLSVEVSEIDAKKYQIEKIISIEPSPDEV